MEFDDDQTFSAVLRQFIHEHPEKVKKDVEPDDVPSFVRGLPLNLRSDPVVLKVAIDHVSDDALTKLFSVIPAHALTEHELLLFQALDRSPCHLEESQIPNIFWHNREFVLKWSEMGKRIRIATLPPEFSNDRGMCLSLYKNKFVSPYLCHNNMEWISQSLLADKGFVIECLAHYPTIFHYCPRVLNEDFDVRLEAAVSEIRWDSFPRFARALKESFDLFVQQVYRQLQPHDEFMTFLGCSWKCRITTRQPLSILECDNETTRGLKTVIAQYIGFRDMGRLMRLRRVWDEIILMVIEGNKLAMTFMPLICRKSLVQGVINAIENKRKVELQSFPEELWANRSFVLWGATKCMFHNDIPVEFSEDKDICLEYYKHSPGVRKIMFPWISDSLKSNRAFVMDCAKCDPLILSYCRMYGIQHDFELLLHAVYHAATNARLDDLIETAHVGGWADELTEFSKTVRAKTEAKNALELFQAEANKRSLAFAGLANVNESMESYLGIVKDLTELSRLKCVWSFHSIFVLAIGGCVEDLCRANKYRPKRRQHEFNSDNDDDDDDDYY